MAFRSPCASSALPEKRIAGFPGSFGCRASTCGAGSRAGPWLLRPGPALYLPCLTGFPVRGEMRTISSVDMILLDWSAKVVESKQILTRKKGLKKVVVNRQERLQVVGRGELFAVIRL